MKITKRFTILSIILIIAAALSFSGCSKAQPSIFEMDGETLLYKGDIENGTGTLYLGSEKVFEGQFVNGSMQGEGKLYVDGKLRYEGEFAENSALGSGTLYNSKGGKMFEGIIGHNQGAIYTGTGYLFNEKGQKTYYGDITVTGDIMAIGDNRILLNPTAVNTGILFYPSGEVFYWGNFRNGEPDGTGTYYDEDGNVLVEE